MSEKLKLLLVETELDSYVEYTFKDITEKINDCNYTSFPIEEITLEPKIVWDYGSDIVIIKVKGYRWETDQEADARNLKEVRLAKEAAKKKLEAEKAKREKAELLKKDPEYQKYLEYQKKFEK